MAVCSGKLFLIVAPFAGAWIEIAVRVSEVRVTPVAPFAGAWIEMLYDGRDFINDNVAPFAGAWIEIIQNSLNKLLTVVAPFAGAWIEIYHQLHIDFIRSSLPSRERGLKFRGGHKVRGRGGRSLRGSVD